MGILNHPLYLVMLTLDPEGEEPGVCYDGRKVFTTTQVTVAQDYADQLRIHNPRAEYEVWITMPLKEKKDAPKDS